MADNYLENKMEQLQARKEKERKARQIAWKKRMDAYRKKLEAERLEAERLEAEHLEAERLEAERLEAERLEAERLETELPALAPSAPDSPNA